MTRFLHALALAALILLSLDARLTGVLADELDDCINGSGDTQIQGCSRIIKSGRLFGKPISKADLSNIYTRRGIGYIYKGQLDRAIADYETAHKLAPNNIDPIYNRGRAYYGKGQYDRAIADYTQVIKLAPKFPYSYLNRGVAYEHSGQRDEAIADYSKALKLVPSMQGSKEALKRLGVTP